MFMEYENGKETVTFSTVTKPTSLPEEKDRKEGRRRKKPAKVKRDRERRESWLERRRTGEGKSVADVPAVAPVTEPAPKTPEGTCRTMVTGSTPEEAERRRPVEEPVAAPVTNPAWSEEWLRIRRTEKEITAAEVPATAPVTVPAPATVPRPPDGTWRVMEAGPQGGGPSRGYSPWTGILEVSMATGKTGKDELRSEGDPGTDGRVPPSWIKVVLVLF